MYILIDINVDWDHSIESGKTISRLEKKKKKIVKKIGRQRIVWAPPLPLARQSAADHGQERTLPFRALRAQHIRIYINCVQSCFSVF